MHGTVGKALSCFARDTYGPEIWARIAGAVGAPPEGYESMRAYDAAEIAAVAAALADAVGTTHEDLLGDVGVYLVAHPRAESLRRLMRFGGPDFDAFLHALEDLPARGRLAVPGLVLPSIRLDLTEDGPGRRAYEVACHSNHAGAGHMLMGVLRAMADDYGALALISHEGGCVKDGWVTERLTVEVLLDTYAAGRGFDLAGAAA